jgi:hypothetical protein
VCLFFVVVALSVVFLLFVFYSAYSLDMASTIYECSLRELEELQLLMDPSTYNSKVNQPRSKSYKRALVTSCFVRLGGIVEAFFKGIVYEALARLVGDDPAIGGVPPTFLPAFAAAPAIVHAPNPYVVRPVMGTHLGMANVALVCDFCDHELTNIGFGKVCSNAAVQAFPNTAQGEKDVLLHYLKTKSKKHRTTCKPSTIKSLFFIVLGVSPVAGTTMADINASIALSVAAIAAPTPALIRKKHKETFKVAYSLATAPHVPGSANLFDHFAAGWPGPVGMTGIGIENTLNQFILMYRNPLAHTLGQGLGGCKTDLVRFFAFFKTLLRQVNRWVHSNIVNFVGAAVPLQHRWKFLRDEAY